MYNIENHYSSNNMMKQAMLLAKEGASNGEIPVASIIVNSKTREIISSAYNMVETKKNAILHSEIIAINQACSNMRTKYLNDFEIYITLEPCMMCYTALCYAQISKIYFAAFDNKNGFKNPPLHLHKPEIYGGIMEAESQNILSNFFKKLRSTDTQ